MFFVAQNWTLLYLNDNFNDRSILVISLITFWAFRLTIHIFARHSGQEDYRYIAFRRRWERVHPTWGPIIIPIFHVYLLQYAFFCINNLSAMWIFQYGTTTELNWIDYIGATVFLFGLFFEVVGDWQLEQWKKQEGNVGSGKVITSGLWRYTRHPNYFGEACLWWGIYIISLNVQDGVWTFISAVTITWLLRCVSGVPMLEKRQMRKKAFRRYAKETNTFIPWCPKTLTDEQNELLEKEDEEWDKKAEEYEKNKTVQ